MSNATATYQELDATRTPIEWDGFRCIMLGTISQAGITRRMDGSLCTPPATRTPNPARLETFATSGKWRFEV